MVQCGENSPKIISHFPPQFTYPIFGEEERIFGYQGLRVNLSLAAHNLQPHFEISYDKKFKTLGDTKATDILETLKPWTPEGSSVAKVLASYCSHNNIESFEKLAVYNQHIQNDPSAESFKPPGELLEKYTSRGRNFEIWNGELCDPAVKLLISRMQILISFFIEGGTPLELDDQEWSLARWRVYFV